MGSEPLLPLTVFADEFGLVKLEPDDPVPDAALRGAAMCFVARTNDELSIVAPLRTLASVVELGEEKRG